MHTLMVITYIAPPTFSPRRLAGPRRFLPDIGRSSHGPLQSSVPTSRWRWCNRRSRRETLLPAERLIEPRSTRQAGVGSRCRCGSPGWQWPPGKAGFRCSSQIWQRPRGGLYGKGEDFNPNKSKKEPGDVAQCLKTLHATSEGRAWVRSHVLAKPRSKTGGEENQRSNISCLFARSAPT